VKPEDIAFLFQKYGHLIYRRAYYLLGHPQDAQEATQEVFIKAMKSAEAFEHRSQIYTWLSRITTNHCLNLIRSKRRRLELCNSQIQTQGKEITERYSEHDLMFIRSLLAEADERCAEAAVYVLIDGMSHQEAAKLLGVSRRTVGNLLERFKEWARQRLKGRPS
jgi:RNA polymerase sigma-70 factor (ECF subfamily)